MPDATSIPFPILTFSCIPVQFNLDVEELDIAQRELDHWRRDPLCPMIIEVALCSAMSQPTVINDSAGHGSTQPPVSEHRAQQRIY